MLHCYCHTRQAGGGASPGVTEEVRTLSVGSPHQPLPEGGVAKHARLVPPFDEEAGEQLDALLEVLPLQLALDESGVDRLEQLLVSQGVQGRQRHVEDGQGALKGRVGHELYVALQLVELGQRDGDHLVAGALDDQVASLEQVQRQLEVQVGALATRDQVAAELSHSDGVGFAVQVDVVHDILAAADAVLNVRIEVVAYFLVVGTVVQRNLGEGQKAGDFLRKRRGNVTVKYVHLRSYADSLPSP